MGDRRMEGERRPIREPQLRSKSLFVQAARTHFILQRQANSDGRRINHRLQDQLPEQQGDMSLRLAALPRRDESYCPAAPPPSRAKEEMTEGCVAHKKAVFGPWKNSPWGEIFPFAVPVKRLLP